MKLLSFTGETPAEALKIAQSECGENALVVSTKQIKKKSISSPSLYEVVVAVDEKAMQKSKTKENLPHIETKQPARQKKSEDVLLNISEAAKQISRIAKVAKSSIPEQKSSSDKKSQAKKEDRSYDELAQIKTQISDLCDKVKIIQNMIWEEKASQRGNLVIPPEFSQIYKIAKQSGMSSLHLDSIMQLTLEHMPLRMRGSTETIKRYFQVLLRKMIPVRLEAGIQRGTKKIMMFVGPTGVGKTTTLAKLAARFSYISAKRYKVGIITLDTYRIGAVEQLFQYAKMMRLPIEDVADSNDFDKAVNSLSHCDIILIDTVGSSQYDKEKVAKLEHYLKKTDSQIDVNLVLSAGTKLDDLQDIYDNYSFLDIDTLIFTKMDETRGFGNIFSLINDTKKPISYFSIGQEVPDDIITASGDFLVDCLLDGFKKEKR